MKRLISMIILYMIIPMCILAQSRTVSYEDHEEKTAELTGIWIGNLYNDSTQQFHRYEVAILKDKRKYIGYSYTNFKFGDKEYYAVKKLKIKIANDGKVVIYDDELLRNNLPELPEKNSSQLNVLSLETDAGAPTLNGLFVTNQTKKYVPLTGKVTLTRSTQEQSSQLFSIWMEGAPGVESGSSNEVAIINN